MVKQKNIHQHSLQWLYVKAKKKKADQKASYGLSYVKQSLLTLT